MAVSVGSFPVEPASLVALVLAVAIAAVVIYRLDTELAWGATLRRRFVLGVPWGTVIVVGFVVAVYLFVQGAWGDLRNPVVVGFRAWSYTYLPGVLFAPFAHNGLGHVTGNLLATVVFAPIAEYAWGHYPTARGSRSFAGRRTNPYARIGEFVVVVLAVGVVTAAFVPGPLIGFSGVVFAFAGFAVVTKPLLAVFAIVGSRVVDLVYYSALNPVITATAEPQFVTPWWAGVAVQAHALGLVLGVLVGVALLAKRSEAVSARRVFLAALVFAVAQSLYAIYWQFGPRTFVMYRGAGLALLFLLATAIVVGAASTDRRLLARERLNRRQVAVGLLLAVVLAIGIAAVPYNLADVDGIEDDGIQIRDYTVTYAEDVPNGYVSAVTIPFLPNATGSVTASGVIVSSERRNAWSELVPASRLAFEGRSRVTVGGLGWREDVIADRSTWNAIDAGSTYKVFLRRPGTSPELFHRDDPVKLAPTIATVNLTIEPTSFGYRLNASRNGTELAGEPMPAANESVQVSGVTVERKTDTLYAVHEGTRVRIAVRETGREQAQST